MIDTLDDQAFMKPLLTKAELLESPRRGVFRLIPRGRRALDEAPSSIDNGNRR